MSLAFPTLLALAVACGGSTGLEPRLFRPPSPPPNVLLVVVNELHPTDLDDPTVTANLARLRRRGLSFSHAVSYAGSSATRAAVLTGRYGRHTGFGGAAEPDGTTWELPLSEVVLAELLARHPDHAWSTAALGSWHLATPRSPHAFDHPNLQGFDHFAGTLADVTTTAQPSAWPAGYRAFEKTIDGQPRWVEAYATQDVARDAVAQLSHLEPPWLLYVAFHALRGPHADPPPALHTQPLLTPGDVRRATLQATDRMLGTVLDALPDPDHTVVVVLGTARDPESPSVPLIVTGPGFVPGTSDAYIHTVDVFPTIAELADLDVHDLPLDGVSFAPLLRHPASRGGRRVQVWEHFAPVGTPPYLAGAYDIDRATAHDAHLRLDREGRDLRWTELATDDHEPREAHEDRLLRALPGDL